MNTSSLRDRLILTALACFALASPRVAAAPQAEGRFERMLSVSGTVELEVHTGAGSITVRPGPAGGVIVVGAIKARDSLLGTLSALEKVRRLEANPPIVQSGNAITIGRIQDRALSQNVSISYEITAPPSTSLRGNTGSGHISVTGLNGAVKVSTGSGGIDIADAGGSLHATTGSGAISLANIRSSVHAETGSGGIRLEQSGSGDVELQTGSGRVEAFGVRGALRIRTGSGSIRAEGHPAGPWSLRAASGGITVRLPRDLGFELDARTSSGSISTAHEITFVGTLNRHELRGKVRGGGVLIELKTSSGSIRIE